MASSNPLRAQNRQQLDRPGILKNAELVSASTAFSKRGSENLDPSAPTELCKANKLKGVSRLPVLARSLQPSVWEPSQNLSHNRWEQKPLAGKAPKKRACTKPVPFNLSQSRMHSKRSTNTSQEKTPLTDSAEITHAERKKFTDTSGKTESHKATTPGVLVGLANKTHQLRTGSSLEHETSNNSDLNSRLGRITLLQSKLPEESSNLCKTQLIISRNQAFQSVSSTTLAAKGSSMNLPSATNSVQPVEGQAVMPRLSTCPSGPGTYNNVPQRVAKKNLLGIDGNGDKPRQFSPDPSALHSILQGDETRLGDHVAAAHRISTCPTGRGTSIYSAQRVPAKKIQKETPAMVKSPAGRNISLDPSEQNNGGTPQAADRLAGFGTPFTSARRVPFRKPQTDKSTIKALAGGAVPFSPDPTALRSILLNEGIGAGGTTPGRVSICPRTSIFSAQRVPVKKTNSEVTLDAGISHNANPTPMVNWTPQRVARTKPQSMRKPCTTQKMSSLSESPDLYATQERLVCQEGEDVVQRLFEDQELNDDEKTGQDDFPSQPPLNIKQNIDGQETMKENSDLNTKKTTQPFIQAAHRASVIVFSSRPLSDPSQDTSKSHGTAAPLQVCEDRPSSQNAEQNPSLDWTKPSKSKVFVAGNVLPTRTALSAMRLRHANLAEMFLDEECATYTSRLLSCPLQPRSGNPVATTLLFKDSTCFSPINLSSPLQPSPAPTSPSIRA